MKGFGLRTLVILAGVVALFSLVGAAYTVTQLEAIASNELVPEISAAAGMALASSYAQTMTQAQLETLAVNGATIGLRTAASNALSILYRSKTEDELTAILTGDADPMIRAAAIDPIQKYLFTKTSDAEGFVLTDYLKDLAVNGSTHEMRLAAAEAYYLRMTVNGQLSASALEAQAAKNDSAELEYAAGQTLAGFYLMSAAAKTQAQLEELAQNGATEGLRTAGGVALSTKLIDSSLTAQEMENTLLADFGAKSQAYLDAYKVALSARFSS